MKEILIFVAIIAVIVLVFLAWFFIGAALKFLLLWLPSMIIMAVSITLGIIAGGYFSVVIIFIGTCLAFIVYEFWEGSDLYFRYEKKLGKIFHFEK